MIDTVVLSIPRSKYTILDHNRFEPSTKGLFYPPYYSLGSRSNFSCKQNPTKKDYLSGIYKPRLTITKRIRKGGYVYPLRIEFSIPKLIFSNNFDEIQESDFNLVIDTLKERLKEMAILIKKDDLVNTKVSAIHYSKNIALVNYTSCSMILGELAKINLTKRLDLDKTSFRNGGQAIHCHANSFDIAIYDKIKDLEQAKVSEKRSTEKNNQIQLNLFDKNPTVKPFEVIRIEIRLNNRTKIKSLLKSLKMTTEPTFINLYSDMLSKNIILYFWKEIEESSQILSIDTDKPSELFRTIIKNNTGIRNTKTLKILATIFLVQEIGFRNTRNLFDTNYKSNKFWYNLIKELKETRLPMNGKYNPIEEVSRSIKEFKPLKLKYYQIKNKINEYV
ncbi:MAG TPA: hypothetical protein GX708_03370 [Gallicola sp.]|nr:hypothetical protein [Gallicola sp.]